MSTTGAAGSLEVCARGSKQKAIAVVVRDRRRVAEKRRKNSRAEWEGGGVLLGHRSLGAFSVAERNRAWGMDGYIL